MYNTVKIGERMVPMMAMASCDVYYRNIFHEDAIKLQTKKDLDEGDLVNFVMRMGFVMAKFAELKDRKEMNKLNEALGDVRLTYEGQAVTVSDSKKKDE